MSYFTIFILWDMKTSSQNKKQVIPFLNNIRVSKDFWSFRDGLYNAIKITSKFFFRYLCEGAGGAFKMLLIKLATEETFTLNNNFFKQIDGCTMGGSLSATLI